MKCLVMLSIISVPLCAMEAVKIPSNPQTTSQKILALSQLNDDSGYKAQALAYAFNRLNDLKQRPELTADVESLSKLPSHTFMQTWNKYRDEKKRSKLPADGTEVINRAAAIPAQSAQLVELAKNLIDQALDLFMSSNISDVKKQQIKKYIAYGASIVGFLGTAAGFVYSVYHCNCAVTTGS